MVMIMTVTLQWVTMGVLDYPLFAKIFHGFCFSFLFSSLFFPCFPQRASGWPWEQALSCRRVAICWLGVSPVIFHGAQAYDGSGMDSWTDHEMVMLQTSFPPALPALRLDGMAVRAWTCEDFQAIDVQPPLPPVVRGDGVSCIIIVMVYIS